MILFTMGGTLMAAPAKPKPPASIVFFRGPVEIYHLQTKKWLSARLDFPLQIGDMVVTKEGGRAELEFSIGDIVRLSELSRLEIKKTRKKGSLKKKTLLNLFKGEVLSKVDKIKGSQQEFAIQTPVAVAAVKGTTYLVRYDEEDLLMDVEVLEGEVEILGETGPPVVVPANQAAAVASGAAPSPPRELSAAEQQVLRTWEKEMTQRQEEKPAPPTPSIPAEKTEQKPTDDGKGDALAEQEKPTLEAPLPQITNLEVDIEASRIFLSWDVTQEDGLGGFVLYRSDEEVSRYHASLREARDVVTDIPGIIPGRSYRYTLVPHDQNGDLLSSRQKEIVVAIPDSGPVIESLFINNKSMDSLTSGELILHKDDLIDNRVVLNGTASQEQLLIRKVEASVDGGQSWQAAEGTTAWRFEFTPQNDVSYEIQIRAENDLGVQSEPSLLDQVSVSYQPLTNTQILSEILGELIRYLNGEDVQGILDMVSDDFYGGKDTFQNELERAFSAWNDIEVTIRNLTIDIVGESQATVQFAWEKLYTQDDQRLTATGTYQMSFEREEAWKWKSKDGDLLFTLPDINEEPGGEFPPDPPDF